MGSLQDIFSGTADAVFAIDGARHIVYQNEAFCQLSRRPASATLNRKCYEVVCGQTLDGARFCGPDCPAATALLHQKPIENFDISIPQSGGAALWVNVGGGALPVRHYPAAAVYVLRPISARKMALRFANSDVARIPQKGGAGTLTSRERTVLRLLGEGRNTDNLAEALHISSCTVRNHIRSILQKLAVHSRAEAVSYAYRKNLI